MSQTTHAADHAVAFTHTFAHWVRMLISFCSFGFIYPRSFTEGMDLSDIQRKSQDESSKKA